MANQCTCKLCVEYHEFIRVISLLPQAEKQWMKEFYENYSNKMAEANINEAVIDGSWPTAEAVIKIRRERRGQQNGNN